MQAEAVQDRRRYLGWDRAGLYRALCRIRRELADREGVYAAHYQALATLERDATAIVLTLASFPV